MRKSSYHCLQADLHGLVSILQAFLNALLTIMDFFVVLL